MTERTTPVFGVPIVPAQSARVRARTHPVTLEELADAFDAHAEQDREDFQVLAAKLSKDTSTQTRILSVVIALASIAGAFLHSFLG